MTRIKTATIWVANLWKDAAAALDQWWRTIQFRRNHNGRHRLENTLYYGHSAASIVLRLRHERNEARYTQETIVLPVAPVSPAPRLLPFPDWDDTELRWDDTDTGILVAVR